MSKPDPTGARQDYLTEMVDYTLQQLHEIGECKGPPECGECLDGQEQDREDHQKYLERGNRRALVEILQRHFGRLK